MLQTHSLTAYRCSFSYLERNNPIDTDEMKVAIKKGESPNYSLETFTTDYISAVSTLPDKQFADRAILLTQITSTESLPNNVSRIHLQPQAGKHGEPLTVVQKETNRKHRYKKDDVALYDYNVFFYENNGDIVALFHRKGTSGCKTVFLETANNALRKKGMRLNMKLLVPLDKYHNMQNATPSQVILNWVVPVEESSDIADNLGARAKKKKPKTRVIQNLSINLKAEESNPIKSTIENLMNGNIDEKVAMAEITTRYLGDDNRGKFNDAIVDLKIGNRIVSKFRFGEIESQIGAYDITDKLNPSDFVNSLVACADGYYNKIMEV